jgi:F-type H+-transporting ATPase subunit b
LHLYWESAVFAIIAFGILYYLLNRYAFGPLFGIMEKRSDHIQDQLQTAEKNRQESEQLIKEQRQAIQDARKEAYDIIEQSKQTSARQTEEMIKQANAEAARLKADALKEIESEKQKAVAALRSQVSAMSVLIASKIIEKQIDEKSQKQLIDKYLEEVGGSL